MNYQAEVAHALHFRCWIKLVRRPGRKADPVLILTEDVNMQRHRSPLNSIAIVAAIFTVSVSAAAQQAPTNSASSLTAPADNSGINQRDRSSQMKTPTDQPNDKADIRLAAAVRRAIVKDKSLSMSAHNVKLVASQGAVTLRGPVKNADEKSKVEADAKSVGGVSSVDNELDIKN